MLYQGTMFWEDFLASIFNGMVLAEQMVEQLAVEVYVKNVTEEEQQQQQQEQDKHHYFVWIVEYSTLPLVTLVLYKV